MPPSSRVACAVALLLLTAAAQDRPDTVIRTTTRVVQIRVMAEDSKGNPVTDLRKEELQLLDNRKPQPIAFFTAEGSPAAASVGAASSAATAPAKQPEEYAMILMDWRNPAYVDRLRTYDHVRKLLQEYRPRQPLALYIFGRESYLLHDFTNDRGALLRALDSVKDVPYEPDDGPIGKFDARYTRQAITINRELQIFEFNAKVYDSFEALGKVADGLAHLPGRKSLIWVSNGFPIVIDNRAVPGAKSGEVDYSEDMERSIARLTRADIAVYTVDARGLPISSYGDVGTLREFAARTGGTAFYDRNDIDEGMRLALEDSTMGYTLGFTVPPDAAAGLHTIVLRTKRPGVALRYRESYQLDDLPRVNGK